MTLPIWFLLLALVVPRIALFAGWHQGWTFALAQPWAGLSWFFIPRILVLMTIYSAQGFSTWFWIHLVAAFITLINYQRIVVANAKKDDK